MNAVHDKSIDLSTLSRFSLPPVTQMGFVVQSLETSCTFYGGLLNIKKWYRTKITECNYRYKGKPVEMLLDIAVGYSGKTQVELIKVTGPDDNIYYDLNGRDGIGFHHFGVVVNDLKKHISGMKAAGINPLQVGTLKYGGGGVTKVAYMDTMKSAGFILELIETKVFGVNLGMPQWLVSLGRVTGDVASMPL